MSAKRSPNATQAFEKALAAKRPTKHVLRLYVAGASHRSREAILRARHLCNVELKGEFELQVIDVYQQPILARDGQIVAVPTLVKALPLPGRRYIGNLANMTRLFVGLEVDTKAKRRR